MVCSGKLQEEATAGVVEQRAGFLGQVAAVDALCTKSTAGASLVVRSPDSSDPERTTTPKGRDGIAS